MNESGELIFLRYAFPATECCSHGKVLEAERVAFIKFLKEGGTPDRGRLEELFPNAVMHLRSWVPEDVRDYWCRKHNEIVADNAKCKVYGLQVAEVKPGKDDEVCRAGIGNESKYPSYLSLSPGDYFTLHNFMVSEKLTKEQYEKYFSVEK